MQALLDDSGARGSADALLDGGDLAANHVAHVLSAGHQTKHARSAAENEDDDDLPDVSFDDAPQSFKRFQLHTLSLRAW